MRVLSIRQPYAWLIIAGLKPVENRTRPLRYRGPLLIHAGRKRAATPLSEIERSFGVRIPEHGLRFGGIVGIVELVDCVTAHPSRWFEGPFGLVLRDPRPLSFIPMAGRLSLFRAPEALSSLLASSASPA